MTDSLVAGGGNTDFATKVALAAEGGSPFAERINILRQAEEAANKAKQDLGIAGDAAKAFDEANVKLGEAKAKLVKAKAEAEALVLKAKADASDSAEKANNLLSDAGKVRAFAEAEAKALKESAEDVLKSAQTEAKEILRSARAEAFDLEKAAESARAVAAEVEAKKADLDTKIGTLDGAVRDFMTTLRRLTNGG